MRNTKLWSVLLAAVLLCACIVGVFVIGANADGTAYKWYVDGVGTATDSYATIDAAMTAARTKTDWAAGDSLTIYITADKTGTTFGSSGGSADNSNRNLFNTHTIFRADLTKLPITIDGDNPNTADAEKVSLTLGTPKWDFASDGVMAFAATNDYTFKNLDLSAWAATTNAAFYAGSAEVTFNNVEFGDTQNLIISSAVSGWTPFVRWSQEKFDANADTDGLLNIGFTFIGTDYGAVSGVLTGRPNNIGIRDIGIDTGYGLTIKNDMVKSNIVIGTGSTAEYISFHSANAITNVKASPAESIIVVDGGKVTNLIGLLESHNGAANKMTAIIKSGTVTNLNMGPNGGTYTGDLEINWLGGTVTNYKSVVAGTVNGTVTNYVKGQDVSGFTANGFNMGGTLSGTLHNIYENCDCGGGRFLGVSGKAPNLINTFKGTFTTSNENLYLGTNDQRISGNIINNIEAEFITPSGGVAYGGSNSGVVGGTITNNILPGAKIDVFIGGCNGGSAAGIVNNITGGEITNFRAAHGINNQTTLASVKSTITGGTITTFQGASSEKSGDSTLITKIENFIGKVEEDGTYSGDAVITNFNGGSSEEIYKAGTIVNTMYSGTVTNFYGAGTYKITAGLVENYMYGGTIPTYFFGGGNANAITGDINNYFYGTKFDKGAGDSGGAYGGSASGAITGTVTNYYGEKDGETPIRLTKDKHQGIVGGNQASNTVTKVVNHFENCEFATVTYAGSRLGSVTTIENNFYDDFKFTGSSFYCGVNNSTVKHITNNFYGGSTQSASNVIYCGNANAGLAGTDTTLTNNFLGGSFHYIYGGNVANSVQGTLTNNFGKVEEDGTITGNCKIETFYGGCNSGGTVAVLNNNFYSGTLGKSGAETEAANGNTFGGCKATAATTINNNFRGTKFLGWLYAGCDTGTAGNINNNIYALSSSIFCGNRAGTVTNITSVFGVENEVEDDIQINNCYGGSRGGAVTGTISTTINGGTYTTLIGAGSVAGASYGNIANTIKGGTIGGIHDGTLNGAGTVTSIATTLEGNVTITGTVNVGADFDAATFTIKEGANISIGNSAKLNVTDIEGAFTLTQTDYWRDSWVYLNGADVTGKVTVVDNVLGTYDNSDSALTTGITGKSDLTAKSANFILTERVAIRIEYDKPVLETYGAEHMIVRVNGQNVKVEVDPKNANAIIIYGIGLADFDKAITFVGAYLPALGSDIDSIVELSDYAVDNVANNKIYQAIADFGRVYAGKTAEYGLEYTEVTKSSQMNATPDPTALHITGKNLVMKDAMGIRYYGTLVGDTAIEDIKVYIDGDDYTDYCNIAFVGESTTELTIDIYLGIKSMEVDLNVKITAGETVALDYIDYADAIAQKIINTQEDTALAKAALVYIQAANTL